jgi:hypothetical protein
MDPVTLLGIVVVAVMFTSGVVLVWMGLRRRPDRLPEGAESVLVAVASGRLSVPDRPEPDLVRPPATPPRAEPSTPAVRLVPRDLEQTPIPPRRPKVPTPAAAPAPAAGPAATSTLTATRPSAAPAEADSTALFVADLNRALQPTADDSDTDGGFFDAEPRLQRF